MKFNTGLGSDLWSVREALPPEPGVKGGRNKDRKVTQVLSV